MYGKTLLKSMGGKRGRVGCYCKKSWNFSRSREWLWLNLKIRPICFIKWIWTTLINKRTYLIVCCLIFLCFVGFFFSILNSFGIELYWIVFYVTPIIFKVHRILNSFEFFHDEYSQENCALPYIFDTFLCAARHQHNCYTTSRAKLHLRSL